MRLLWLTWSKNGAVWTRCSRLIEAAAEARDAANLRNEPHFVGLEFGRGRWHRVITVGRVEPSEPWVWEGIGARWRKRSKAAIRESA